MRVIAPTVARATELANWLDDDDLAVDLAIAGGRAIRSAGTGPERCDVIVVTDIERASDLHGLARAAQDVPVVVVGAAMPVARARQLLDAGAASLVDADNGLEALRFVARVAAHGELVLPRQVREVVEPISLSTRERQVLALMSGGLTNQEIAEQMFLSESTVKSHAASAFRRLGVHSRREAVALVLGSNETLRRAVLMSHPVDRADRPDEPRPGDREDSGMD